MIIDKARFEVLGMTLERSDENDEEFMFYDHRPDSGLSAVRRDKLLSELKDVINTLEEA